MSSVLLLDPTSTNSLRNWNDTGSHNMGAKFFNLMYNNDIADNNISATDVKGVGKLKTFIVLKPGEDGYIVAECPSMPGCISQGKTKSEALANIKEAIELWLEVARERKLQSPFEICEVEV